MEHYPFISSWGFLLLEVLERDDKLDKLSLGIAKDAILKKLTEGEQIPKELIIKTIHGNGPSLEKKARLKFLKLKGGGFL